ncbi:MAG: hypothetical protein IJK15_02570 [Bacteroidaceae bacterium]|nr:hypothetical protein [Bacteroidaceae bacterium]
MRSVRPSSNEPTRLGRCGLTDSTRPTHLNYYRRTTTSPYPSSHNEGC